MHSWYKVDIGIVTIENSKTFLKKLNLELLCDPVIPLLATYLKEIKLSQRDICIPKSTAAFAMAKIWKKTCVHQSMYRKKNVIYTYNGIYSAIKRRKSFICKKKKKRLKPESIALSKIILRKINTVWFCFSVESKNKLLVTE